MSEVEAIEPTTVDGRPIVFINAYAVDQCYGGREEGGWYYDAGTALGSIAIIPAPGSIDPESGEITDPETNEAIERAREVLRARFGPDYADNRHRSSVIGGSNLEIYRERHPPRDYPTVRPRYE